MRPGLNEAHVGQFGHGALDGLLAAVGATGYFGTRKLGAFGLQKRQHDAPLAFGKVRRMQRRHAKFWGFERRTRSFSRGVLAGCQRGI